MRHKQASDQARLVRGRLGWDGGGGEGGVGVEVGFSKDWGANGALECWMVEGLKRMQKEG